jgi:novel protein kinase C epsilon type
MNVHKRCQKNVANNCGINPKQIALLLQQLGISENAQPTTSKNSSPALSKSVKKFVIFM